MKKLFALLALVAGLGIVGTTVSANETAEDAPTAQEDAPDDVDDIWGTAPETEDPVHSHVSAAVMDQQPAAAGTETPIEELE